MSDNMATKLKRKLSAKNITAIILFGAIIIVFVFFGLPNQLTGSGQLGSAARVNNVFISVADFYQEQERISQYYAQILGGAMDLGPQRQMFQREALERLINAELSSQAARREGIAATDAEVRQFIISDLPFLQEKGIFQREYYQRFLEMSRLSTSDFENKVRKNIETLRLQRLFEIAAKPMSIEKEKESELKRTQWNLGFVKFDDEKISEKIKVPDIEVQKSLADVGFAKQVEEHFNMRKGEFFQPEKFHSQMILVKFNSTDTESVKKAQEKIEKAKAELNKEEFSKVVTKYSEDLANKDKKGDMGFVARGTLPVQVEQALSALSPGQVSDIVKSDVGFHLIKLLEKKPAVEPKLEDHRQKIALKILAEKIWSEESKKIENYLLEKKEAELDATIKKLGFNWEETGFFSLDVDSIPKLQGKSITSAVFEMNSKSSFLPRFVREGTSRYLLKLKAQKKADITPSEKLSDTEFSDKRKGQEMFGSWIQEFRKTAKIETNSQLLK